MAPVHIPPNNSKPQQEKPKKPTERRPELFCRVKYCNTLPDIPFDPKFISYPFDTGRFVQYKQTSLEKNYKHDLLTEQDLGVAIDLINPETYEISDSGSRLAEEDERLLEDEHSAPQDTKRSRCHNRAITWLKKTEYISTEFNRYGSSSDKTETKLGFGVKKKLKEENLYLDRENQILVINKTFESAKKPIMSHPGKPGIKPVEILPVFPDFDGWKYPFAQVIFDADPASSEKEEEMSQAMIRGVMDESGQQFVAYFLPTQDTINKRKIDQLEERDYTEDQEYEYIMAREYNWNVKNKATKGYEENYFFVWKDDVVCYNELETRVKLSKRRVKHNQPTNSRLVVKHRPINEQEYKVQEIRFAQLEPPQDDEELNNDEDVDAEEKSKEADDKINSPDDYNQNIQSESEKSESSDSEVERNSSKRTKVSDESEEKSSSSSASSSSSSGSSSDDSEDEEESRRKRQKQTAADIFGSDSD